MFIAESVNTIAPHHLPTVDPNPSSQSTPGYSPNSPFAQAVRNLGMDRPEVDEDTYDKFRKQYFDGRIAPRLQPDQLETQRQVFLQRTQRPKSSPATYPSTLTGVVVAARVILILALIGGVRGTFAYYRFRSNAPQTKPCCHGVTGECQRCEAGGKAERRRMEFEEAYKTIDEETRNRLSTLVKERAERLDLLIGSGGLEAAVVRMYKRSQLKETRSNCGDG